MEWDAIQNDTLNPGVDGGKNPSNQIIQLCKHGNQQYQKVWDLLSTVSVEKYCIVIRVPTKARMSYEIFIILDTNRIYCFYVYIVVFMRHRI